MGGGNYGAIKAKKKTIDFYVGPNKMALPSKYKNWIGVSRRESLLKRAKNKRLYNAINQLYKPSSFIGDGGTASVLIFEKRTGEKVSKNGHAQKAYEMRKNIINKVLKENLTKGERKIANRLLKKLNKAIWSWEEKI